MKHLLLKTWLMLVMLLVGVGTMWGETVVFDPTTAVTEDAASYQDGPTTFAAGGGNWTATGYGADNGKYIKLGRGTGNYLETPVLSGNITSITVTWYQNTSYYLAVQTTTGTELEAKQSTASSSDSPQTYTFNITGSYKQLRLVARRSSGTNNALATISRIEVTYSAGGSTPDPEPASYTVTVANNITGGTVTASTTSATAGTTVNLTATPSTGYEFGSWNVTGATVANNTSATTSFTMPSANVSVSATFNEIQGGGEEPEPSGEGETGTITFNNTSDGIQISSASVTGKDDLDNSWTITTVGTTSFTQNNTYSQVGSGNKPATSITFTTTLPNNVTITSMSAKFGGFSGTAGTVTLKVGETTIGTGSLNAANDVTVNSTSTASGNVLTVTVTGIAKGVKVYYISYTYDGGDTPGEPEKTTPTLSFANPTYNATMGEAFVAPTLNNEQNVAVTYTSSFESVATVNAETGAVVLVGTGTTTITASFEGDEDYNEASASYELVVAAARNKYIVTILTPENGTLTIKDGETVINSGDEVAEGTTLTIECTPASEDYRFKNWGYKDGDAAWVGNMTSNFTHTMPSAPCSFKATFELIPTYTVNWSVNGVIEQSDNLKEGATISAPADPADINGKTFTGWVTTPTVDADANPAYATPSTATADVTYYAVFATQEGDGTSSLSKITNINQVVEGTYALISYDEAYYLPNTAATGNAPSLGTVTKTGGDINFLEEMKWTLTIDANGAYVFKSNASTEETVLYLWGSTTNEGIRINTTSAKTNPFNTWELKSTNDYGLVLCHKIDNTTYRYLSTYATTDWRNYTSTNTTNRAANIYKYSSGSNYSDFTTNPLTQTFDLTVGEAGYATLCLAYNATVPSGVQIFTGKYENDGVTLTQPIDDDKVCARVGYIVKANPDTYTFTQTIDEVTAPTENDLVGVLENTDMTEHRNDGRTFIFTKQNETVGFYVCTGGTLGANKAYLYTPETQSRTFIGFGDDETSINIVEKENITDGKFIEGNKVIIVKNGVKYNVNGQRLR